MLQIQAGQMGGGKSYRAVREMVRWSRRMPGRPIYTNLEISEEGYDFFGRDRIRPLDYKQVGWWWRYTSPGSLIVIDEGQVHFDSRAFSMRLKKDPDNEFGAYMSHIRKYGDEVLILTQEFGHIDARIRQLCHMFHYTISLKAALQTFHLWIPGMPEWFVNRTYKDEEKKDFAGSQWYRCDPRIYTLYDSWGVATGLCIGRLSDPVEITTTLQERRKLPFSYAAAASIAAALAAMI